MKNNQFRIAGGLPNGKVSWQVTGVRQDRFATAYPIPVEGAKSTAQTGKYLHPELYR